jgi:phosphoglycolate phosphatase
MSKKMIKNIIFDWSGTLSDDLTPVYMATMLVMKFLIGKKISIKEYKREFTLPYMDFWHKYIPDLKKQKCDRLFLKAINKVSKPKPYPNVKKSLKILNLKGIKMILISSHPFKKLIEECQEYGFYHYFQEVNGGVHNKIKVINSIMKRNRFNSKETCYVGDMVHDINAGKEVKVLTVALTWGYQDKGRLLQSRPDFLIDDITELKRIISCFVPEKQ